MSEFSFTLPVPPSANRYWRVANNRIIVSPEASSYKQQVFLQLRNYEPLRGDVAVNFTVFRPMKRGDLDNFTKVMFDALKGLVWLDDSQVVEIHSFRADDKQYPRVEFLVYEVNS
jgi:Holliday junction resolvase RusA-like endonuclease